MAFSPVCLKLGDFYRIKYPDGLLRSAKGLPEGTKLQKDTEKVYRPDVIQRSRTTLINLLLANEFLYFSTFTFKGYPDSATCRQRFRKFRERYCSHYIYVEEYQSRGVLHFHMLSEAPPKKDWQYGFFDVKQIGNLPSDKLGVGLYLSKYLMKTYEGNYRRLTGSKLYSCSRDLIRPEQICIDDLPDDIRLVAESTRQYFIPGLGYGELKEQICYSPAAD